MPFPEIETPVNRGTLRNSTFRWKPATTGAPPSVYNVIVINLATSQRWDFYVPGNQRKFRLPQVPQLDHDLQPDVPGQEPISGVFRRSIFRALITRTGPCPTSTRWAPGLDARRRVLHQALLTSWVGRSDWEPLRMGRLFLFQVCAQARRWSGLDWG